MTKIRVFETFAGIGAQATAFRRTKISYEVVATSEWYIDALLAYDAINNFDKKIKIPSYSSQLNYLKKFTFSKDAMNPYKDISKLTKEEIKQLYIANVRNKNLGSITEIKAFEIPDHDLLTYSFPCQDLSTGGKTLGMSKGSGTRSGLLWEIERLLNELSEQGRLPKYLLMENVKAILAPSNSLDFGIWKSFLESIGYKNYIYVLNGVDFNVPQDRKRTFMISSLNSELNLNIDRQKRPFPKSKVKEFLKLDYLDQIYKEEADEAQLNRTPSRELMWGINKRDLDNMSHFNTITTNMDRQNNAGMILYSGIKGNSYRMPTAREAFMMMGFTEEEYERVKELGFSYRKTIKLAGNSIIVTILEAIFKEMFMDAK